MDDIDLDAETLRYADFVDIHLGRGETNARRGRKGYHVAYFAKALWEARPFIEAAQNSPDEPKGRPVFLGATRTEAIKLVQELQDAVHDGNRLAIGGIITRMRIVAKYERLPMPSLQYIPTPRRLMN